MGVVDQALLLIVCSQKVRVGNHIGDGRVLFWKVNILCLLINNIMLLSQFKALAL